MSPIEIVAVVLGLANIVLLVRRSIWNYPFGIATVILQAWLFLDGKLYSDALLQLFFAVLNVYGWMHWARAQGDDGVPVRWMGARPLAASALAAAAATLAWGTMMHRHTDAAFPYWDASVAMMSVLAQTLLARRWIDNWTWWIIVDLVAVPLYWTKGLFLIAGLYVVYLLISVLGLLSWHRMARR
jgi:nicotinamide mononucleotide transporter